MHAWIEFFFPHRRRLTALTTRGVSRQMWWAPPGPIVLWQNWYTRIPNVACITQDTILTMILMVRRYRDIHRRPQAHHKIDYLERTRWILKDIKRKTHNLTWFDSKLANVHEERTWESFIYKLDTKISNISLNDTRVFTFLLSLYLDYKSLPSLYASSPFSIFLTF